MEAETKSKSKSKTAVALVSLFAVGLLLFSCNPFWPEDTRPDSPAAPTADIRIGANGNWWINGDDTGIPVNGPPRPRLGDSHEKVPVYLVAYLRYLSLIPALIVNLQLAGHRRISKTTL